MNSAHKYAVVDTSTLISVMLKPQSIPNEAFQRLRKNFRLVASDATLEELAGVLSRKKFDAFRTAEERSAFFKIYCAMVQVCSVNIFVTDCRDPKDNKFLDLALSAQASVILCSDPDLLVLNPYQDITIVNPRDFLELEYPNL